jgi:hypothetical protein
MKLLLKLFVLCLVIDVVLGFSMSALVGNTGEPGLVFKIIDEVISFPLVLWNRSFPEYGIFRATTNMFWYVVVSNAFIQAVLVYGIILLLRRRKVVPE